MLDDEDLQPIAQQIQKFLETNKLNKVVENKTTKECRQVLVEEVHHSTQLQLESDHLSRVEWSEDPTGIDDDLPDAHLFKVEAIQAELVEIGEYLQEGKAPNHYSKKKKKILTINAAHLQ